MLADWQGADSTPFGGLSSREMQIAMLIIDGRRPMEISNILCLKTRKRSAPTADAFMRMLQVKTDAGLTRLAFRHGLI